MNQKVAKSLSTGHAVYLKSKQRALHDLTESWLFARNILPSKTAGYSRGLELFVLGYFYTRFLESPMAEMPSGFFAV